MFSQTGELFATSDLEMPVAKMNSNFTDSLNYDFKWYNEFHNISENDFGLKSLLNPQNGMSSENDIPYSSPRSSLFFCGSKSGRDRNGMCELFRKNTLKINDPDNPPFNGTVYDIPLNNLAFRENNFKRLIYQNITKGGQVLPNGYYDYRDQKRHKDNVFTFKCYFLNQKNFEVTMPVNDFSNPFYAQLQAEMVLNFAGKMPKYLLSSLKTLAINGPGSGSRAGANNEYKSITVNTNYNSFSRGFELFLHEGAHISLDYLHFDERWKQAVKLDKNNYISTYAKSIPHYEDIAESFNAWMYIKLQDTGDDYAKLIRSTIPNRLRVFDDEIAKHEMFEFLVESYERKKGIFGEIYPRNFGYQILAEKSEVEDVKDEVDVLKKQVRELRRQNQLILDELEYLRNKK